MLRGCAWRSFLGLLLGAVCLAAVPEAERDALVDLYQECHGASWHKREGWLNGDPCENTWFGVGCDDAGEHVTVLEVNPKFAFNLLDCHLPSSLGNLSQLQKLYLSNAIFPSRIKGELPSSLGGLTELRCLYASHNELEVVPQWVTKLHKLQGLFLRHNRLEGSVPDLSELADLRSLWLDANRELTGDIASLSGLRRLHTVTGYLDKLHGPVPPNLCGIKHCDLGKPFVPLPDTNHFACPLPSPNCCEVRHCTNASTPIALVNISLWDEAIEGELPVDICKNKSIEEAEWQATPTAPSSSTTSPPLGFSPSSTSQLSQAQFDWLYGYARGTVGTWSPINATQSAGLSAKADAYTTRMLTRNMHHNMTVDAVYDNNETQTLVLYEDTGDSACWTGHFMAALAHAYNVTQSQADLSAVSTLLLGFERATSITGTGYLVRYACPTSDKPCMQYIQDKGIAGKPPYQDWVWLGYESRDQYMGATLGLVSVLARVDDAPTRARTVAVLKRMIDYLADHHWWIINPQHSHAPEVPNPLFIALFMRVALTIDPTKYKRFELEYPVWFEAAKLTDFSISDLHADSQFPNHLGSICLFAMAMLEPPETTQGKALGAALRKLATSMGGHFLQADWFSFHAAIAGPDTDVVAAAALQATLLDYAPAPKWNRVVNLTTDAEELPHYSADMAQFAVLPNARQPQDTYIWQRNPTLLNLGSTQIKEYQSADFLLPYWVGRYSGIIPKPFG